MGETVLTHLSRVVLTVYASKEIHLSNNGINVLMEKLYTGLNANV